MVPDKDNESLFFMLELMRNVIQMFAFMLCVCVYMFVHLLFVLFVDICSLVVEFKKHLILYEQKYNA